MRTKGSLILCFLLLCGSEAWSQNTDSLALKIRAEVFGDYYYKVQGDSINTALQYTSQSRYSQAFQVRRALISAMMPLGSDFNAQVTLEHNDRTLLQSNQFGFYLKMAFIEWSNLIPGSAIGFGLLPTPTWIRGQSEKLWRYRSVEKTVTDLHSLGLATDLGLSVRGTVGAKELLGYAVMIGNGTGTKPEVNRYKKFYGFTNYRLFNDFVVETYADYEQQTDSTSILTLKGILGWQIKDITVGIEALNQSNEVTTTLTRNRLGISAYAEVNIPGTSQLTALVRYDYFDSDTKESELGYKENLLIAGLDYHPAKNVHFIPNLWISSNSSKGDTPAVTDQVVGRLTFWYTYN